MKVIKHIEKEVNCCAECPYFFEEHDMSITLPCCELLGKGYDNILGDISWRNNNTTISKYCPYKKTLDK